MPRQSIESRVETLETRVAMLEELPARMDRLESQIVQLRAENAAEHSATRQEMQALGKELHGETQALGTQFGEDLKTLRADLVTAMEMLHERQGIEARALFEEAIGRIAAMNEGRPRS